MNLLKTFIKTNKKLSHLFDYLLPKVITIDGNNDFKEQIAPKYLKSQNHRVYDIGGGSLPLISKKTKDNMGLSVVGFDIDSRELEQAPQGIYDELIVADISTYRGNEDADLVICQTALEHVKNNADAFIGIASILKPGGLGLIFTPSKHAMFAKLNIALPEKIKRKLLFACFPEKAEEHNGFPAHYDRCSPKEFRKLAEDNHLIVVDLKPYYTSSYFQIFFPLYIVWRLWILLFRCFYAEDAAETFTMVVQKSISEPLPLLSKQV